MKLYEIKKIVSGGSKEAVNLMLEVYGKIIDAGLHVAPSIKVAEAAKVVENVQSDLNIAFVNELAMMFNKMDIRVTDVLEAASTKWNFLPFQPGLVGGHCISVDPYYLTYKSEKAGFIPDIVTNARKLNEFMPFFISNLILDEITSGDRYLPTKSGFLIVGYAFKEDCPDFRNTKSLEVYKFFERLGFHVEVYDPLCDAKSVSESDGVELLDVLHDRQYQAVAFLVPHKELKKKEVLAHGFQNALNQAASYLILKNVFPESENVIGL